MGKEKEWGRKTKSKKADATGAACIQKVDWRSS